MRDCEIKRTIISQLNPVELVQVVVEPLQKRRHQQERGKARKKKKTHALTDEETR